MSDFMGRDRAEWHEDEDFSRLKLGPEYTKLSENSLCLPLWDDEARALIETRSEEMKEDGARSMLHDVHAYLQKFKKYENKEKLEKAKSWVQENFQEEKFLRKVKDKEQRKRIMDKIDQRRALNGEMRPEGHDSEQPWRCKLKHENDGRSPKCKVCFMKVNLEDLEIASINNLGVTEVEEAIKFIPTLAAKFPTPEDKELLRTLLDSLQSYQIPLAE